MKHHFTLSILAGAAAMIFAAACNQSPQGEGKPYDELPGVQQSDLLAFFKALPEKELPGAIKPQEGRERYFKAYMLMKTDGALADGEGPDEATLSTDNMVYWSDYLDNPDEAMDSEDPHPYFSFNLYHGTQSGKFFAVLRSGAYEDGEDITDPERCYWFDSSSGRLTPAKRILSPEYTADDLTRDALITFGSDELYYSVKEKKFIDNYNDRGFQVIIENVGLTGVDYEWDGVRFVRKENAKLPVIYNSGFANIELGDSVPYSIPGYETQFVSESNPYDSIFYVTKKGEEAPTLVLHSDSGGITQIEVCSEPFVNIYGIGPGNTVDDLLRLNAKYSELWGSEVYFNCNDMDEEFVDIYSGFDEDFVYRVPKSEYLGNDKFVPGAKIARVAISNAVG